MECDSQPENTESQITVNISITPEQVEDDKQEIISIGMVGLSQIQQYKQEEEEEE